MFHWVSRNTLEYNKGDQSYITEEGVQGHFDLEFTGNFYLQEDINGDLIDKKIIVTSGGQKNSSTM